MSRTIIEIAQEAAVDAGYQEPSTIFGDDRLSRTLRTAAQRTIEELMRKPGERGWSALNSLWILETVAGQDQYALPADYHTLVPGASFREGHPVYLFGPSDAQSWAAIRAGGLLPAIPFWFRVRGPNMEFQPAPTSVERVLVEYRSRYPVETKALSGWDRAKWDTATWDNASEYGRSDRFHRDDDLCRLPESLLSLGMTWRLLKARGQAYADERLEYEDATRYAAASDHGGLSEIVLGGGSRGYGQLPTRDDHVIVS